MSSTEIYIDTFKKFKKKGYTMVIKYVRGYYQVQERDGRDRIEITTSTTWLEALKDYQNIYNNLNI